MKIKLFIHHAMNLYTSTSGELAELEKADRMASFIVDMLGASSEVDMPEKKFSRLIINKARKSLVDKEMTGQERDMLWECLDILVYGLAVELNEELKDFDYEYGDNGEGFGFELKNLFRLGLISFSEFIEKIDVKKAAVKKWIKGTGSPSVDEIVRIKSFAMEKKGVLRFLLKTIESIDGSNDSNPKKI